MRNRMRVSISGIATRGNLIFVRNEVMITHNAIPNRLSGSFQVSETRILHRASRYGRYFSTRNKVVLCVDAALIDSPCLFFKIIYREQSSSVARLLPLTKLQCQSICSPSTRNRNSHTELHIYWLTITRHESHCKRIEDSLKYNKIRSLTEFSISLQKSNDIMLVLSDAYKII